jgi:hypothetical protein
VTRFLQGWWDKIGTQFVFQLKYRLLAVSLHAKLSVNIGVGLPSC